ncbi:MAG: cyclic nucleotide-binding domain-containing protein [Elusimicrobia bacterium]|nr:cyclic nucleotide-binding domain-containing protein [Elusimicrobiota bacterium]
MMRIDVGAPELGILAGMLRKVDFFQPLKVGQIDQILPYVMLFEYDQGETVFKQGDPGDAFFIVYTGKVGVKVKTGFLGFSKLIKTLGPGEFFGEMALLGGERRAASVQCLEPTRLFALAAVDFQFVLNENPAAASEIARIASRRGVESRHLS